VHQGGAFSFEYGYRKVKKLFSDGVKWLLLTLIIRNNG